MSREFVALAIMGIDQHENGAIAVARVLREAQMKVDYFGKFHTPGLRRRKGHKRRRGCHRHQLPFLGIPSLGAGN